VSAPGKVILLRQRDFEKMGDAVLLRVWIWCLSRMARRRTKQRVRTGRGAWTQVQVEVGQFAYQRKLAFDALQIPGTTIHDQMVRLLSLRCLTYARSADKQWTLVTIAGHERYLPGASAAPSSMKGSAEGFDDFWAAWPPSHRKKAKTKCLTVWKRKGLSKQARSVMAVLASDKRSQDWKKDAGEYIEAPLVWLNSDRWEADPADLSLAAVADDTMKICMAFDTQPESVKDHYRDVNPGDWARAPLLWWEERRNTSSTLASQGPPSDTRKL